MVLIGLMGVKGSGKSTCARYLVENYNFTEKSFADCLKKACQEIFLLSDEQINGSKKEEPDSRWFNCSPRKMLQFVGTDLLRDGLETIMPGIKNDVFINHFKLWYENEIKENPNAQIVVSDIRFQNEANFIKSLGGIIIKIERSSCEQSDTHVSEVEQRDIEIFDHFIHNNSSFDELFEQVNTIFSVINNNSISK